MTFYYLHFKRISLLLYGAWVARKQKRSRKTRQVVAVVIKARDHGALDFGCRGGGGKRVFGSIRY